MRDAGTKSADDIHEEVLAELDKINTKECIDTVSDLLQDWVHYLDKNNLSQKLLDFIFPH